MARKQPPRMLPPSRSPIPPGAADPAYDANREIVIGLLEAHGDFIHWWNDDEGHASAASIDFECGPPLSIVLPPGPPAGSTADLVRSLMPWANSRDGQSPGVFRLEFDELLSEHRPDLLAAVREQLDAAYQRQDGPPVVAILPEHIIVTTCIDRTQAN